MAKDSVTVRIDADVLAKARKLAAGREWTLSHFVARAVERIVEAELAKQGTGRKVGR